MRDGHPPGGRGERAEAGVTALPDGPGVSCARSSSCRPVQDAVAALGLLDPAELHERCQRLVHPLAGGPHHAGELLLGDGSSNTSAPWHISRMRLAVRPGDVEEHRVGQRLVHVPQPLAEQRHHAPQQLGPALVERPGWARSRTRPRRRARAPWPSAERARPSNIAISPNRSPGSMRASTDSRLPKNPLVMAMRPAVTRYIDPARRPRGTGRRPARGRRASPHAASAVELGRLQTAEQLR